MKFGQWLGLIVLIASLYVLWEIRLLLLLIFTAIVFATALNGVTRRLQSLGVRRKLAAFTTLTFAVLFSILFFVLIVPPFVAQFEKLLDLVPAVFSRIVFEIDGLEERLPGWVTLPSISEIIPQLQPVGTELIKNFFAFFSNSLTIAVQLLFVLVLTLMMFANPSSYRRGFIQLFPAFYRRRVDEILTECEVALGNWLAGICINSIFIATLSGVGLAALGIQLVLAHALMAGVLNFIPNIGPATSVVFPIMVAVLDAPWKTIAVLIWYGIIQQVESYWLTPTVMAKQVSLLPAITLMAQIFFATVFGLLGLILALPLTVVAKVWIEEALFKDILDRWGEEDLTTQTTIETVPPIPSIPESLPSQSPEIAPSPDDGESKEN